MSCGVVMASARSTEDSERTESTIGIPITCCSPSVSLNVRASGVLSDSLMES